MIFSALVPVTCDKAGGFMEQLRFGHKCTAALDPYETAFSGQGVQRLPHRGAADLEPLCQLAFRGNLTAYRLFLTDNAFADIFCNLLVKCLCQGNHPL